MEKSRATEGNAALENLVPTFSVQILVENAIEGSYGEAEDRIGRIAQLIVEFFDGKQ